MATYLITGSSRGLGFQLVSILASSPDVSTVFATSRSLSPALKALVENSSGKVIYVQLEVTNQESVTKAASEVEQKLDGKGLDVLINNAGIMGFSPLETMENLDDHFLTNVMSVHWVTRAFLPMLRKGTTKKIVNISTTLGSIAQARKYSWGSAPAYKISKTALNSLTVQYALHLENEGFVVFALTPGWLKTDLGGEGADLPVEVGARASLEKIWNAGKEENGQFVNIHVQGWEKTEGPNQYDGSLVPW